MIQCDQLKVCFLPIERTGSQSLEQLLLSLDPTLHHTGGHRHAIAEVPRSYKLVVSTRDPIQRLASCFTRSQVGSEFGYGKFFTNFESYVRWLLETRYLPWLDDPSHALFAPRCKLINNELVTQPRPQAYYLSRIRKPNYEIHHSNYESDIRKLTFIPGDLEELPHIDDTDWDLEALRFDGMSDLIAQWEQP